MTSVASVASVAPAAPRPLRFVVGTGRCGSTLLSRMLAKHPDVLSIFEYFNGLDVAKRFAAEGLSGDDFAALIAAEQPFVTAVVRRGYAVEEITYPFADGAVATSNDDPPDPADSAPVTSRFHRFCSSMVGMFWEK